GYRLDLFFFQAEDGIRDWSVTGVQTCALPISLSQFPTAAFKSTSVRKTGDNVFEVTGDFTLNGTTKPLTVTINNTGEGEGRGGRDRKSGGEGEGRQLRGRGRDNRRRQEEREVG